MRGGAGPRGWFAWGIRYFPYPFGCSQTGADHAQTRALLVALSHHPNAAGVLFLSLGCENCTHEQVLAELGDYDPARMRFLCCQNVVDEQAAGHEILLELAERAKLVVRGGTSVLTEVPEMFGAESILLDRCVDEGVFRAAADMLNGFKDYFISHNEVVYDNPSPGNKAGGITTLEDKSCDCVQKGGVCL